MTYSPLCALRWGSSSHIVAGGRRFARRILLASIELWAGSGTNQEGGGISSAVFCQPRVKPALRHGGEHVDR